MAELVALGGEFGLNFAIAKGVIALDEAAAAAGAVVCAVLFPMRGAEPPVRGGDDLC